MPEPDDFPGGSSPRVRGTDRRRKRSGREERFIPAGAGNGVRGLLRRLHRTVHPRGCGERLSGTEGLHGYNGSSPRVRGTVMPGVGTAVGGRFIPAGAGNGQQQQM